MDLSRLYDLASNHNLTGSVITELLTEQPTADETSHAHLHMCDGLGPTRARSQLITGLTRAGRTCGWPTAVLLGSGRTPICTPRITVFYLLTTQRHSPPLRLPRTSYLSTARGEEQ